MSRLKIIHKISYINAFVRKFESNSKTSTSTFFYLFFILVKPYLKQLLRIRGAYNRFEKWLASKDFIRKLKVLEVSLSLKF